MRIEDVEVAYGLKNQMGCLEKDLNFLKGNKSYLFVDIADSRCTTTRNCCSVDDDSPALAKFYEEYQKELETKIEEIKKQIEAL